MADPVATPDTAPPAGPTLEERARTAAPCDRWCIPVLSKVDGAEVIRHYPECNQRIAAILALCQAVQREAAIDAVIDDRQKRVEAAQSSLDYAKSVRDRRALPLPGGSK